MEGEESASPACTIRAAAGPRNASSTRGWRGTGHGGRASGCLPGKGKSGEEREEGRDRGRQLATAVLKTSSMLLGGIEGEKNQTLHKTEQPKQQNTALREVVGTVLHVLPGSEAWLPAERKEIRNYRVY